MMKLFGSKKPAPETTTASASASASASGVSAKQPKSKKSSSKSSKSKSKSKKQTDAEPNTVAAVYWEAVESSEQYTSSEFLKAYESAKQKEKEQATGWE